MQRRRRRRTASSLSPRLLASSSPSPPSACELLASLASPKNLRHGMDCCPDVPPVPVLCSAGSPLRFLPRMEAQELVILASLVPVLSANIAAEFPERIFCSDASMSMGACCSAPISSEISACLWLATDMKGSYTTLDAGGPSAAQDFERDEEEITDYASLKPLAMNYDVLYIFAGAAEVANACGSLGLSVSPIIDLQFSREFDVLSLAFLEWAKYLLWQGRARSLVLALVAGPWSPPGPSCRCRRVEVRSVFTSCSGNLLPW